MRSTICPNRVALGGREATRILVEDMNRAREGCKSPYKPCERAQDGVLTPECCALHGETETLAR